MIVSCAWHYGATGGGSFSSAFFARIACRLLFIVCTSWRPYQQHTRRRDLRLLERVGTFWKFCGNIKYGHLRRPSHQLATRWKHGDHYPAIQWGQGSCLAAKRSLSLKSSKTLPAVGERFAMSHRRPGLNEEIRTLHPRLQCNAVRFPNLYTWEANLTDTHTHVRLAKNWC